MGKGDVSADALNGGSTIREGGLEKVRATLNHLRAMKDLYRIRLRAADHFDLESFKPVYGIDIQFDPSEGWRHVAFGGVALLWRDKAERNAALATLNANEAARENRAPDTSDGD